MRNNAPLAIRAQQRFENVVATVRKDFEGSVQFLFRGFGPGLQKSALGDHRQVAVFQIDPVESRLPVFQGVR